MIRIARGAALAVVAAATLAACGAPHVLTTKLDPDRNPDAILTIQDDAGWIHLAAPAAPESADGGPVVRVENPGGVTNRLRVFFGGAPCLDAATLAFDAGPPPSIRVELGRPCSADESLRIYAVDLWLDRDQPAEAIRVTGG